MPQAYSPEQNTDRRAVGRVRTLKAGQLVFGGFIKTVIDCVVMDMSEKGVRVETFVIMNVPEEVTLRFGDKTTRPVRRCWAQGNIMGFMYLDAPE